MEDQNVLKLHGNLVENNKTQGVQLDNMSKTKINFRFNDKENVFRVKFCKFKLIFKIR